MSKQLLIAISLAALVTNAAAQDTGQGQSLMFENQENNRDYLTTLPANQKKGTRGDRCIEMAQEIERLKGKPQRRSTMMDRYRQECELR